MRSVEERKRSNSRRPKGVAERPLRMSSSEGGWEPLSRDA